MVLMPCLSREGAPSGTPHSDGICTWAAFAQRKPRFSTISLSSVARRNFPQPLSANRPLGSVIVRGHHSQNTFQRHTGDAPSGYQNVKVLLAPNFSPFQKSLFYQVSHAFSILTPIHKILRLTCSCCQAGPVLGPSWHCHTRCCHNCPIQSCHS